MHLPNLLGPGTGHLPAGMGYLAPLAPYIQELPLRMGIEEITGYTPRTKEELEACRLDAQRREEAMGAFIRRNGFDALMMNADPYGQSGVQRVYFGTSMQSLVNSTGSASVTNTGPGNSAIGGVNQAPVAIQPRIPSNSIVSAANNAATSNLLADAADTLKAKDPLCSINAAINENPWIAAALIVGVWWVIKGRS